MGIGRRNIQYRPFGAAAVKKTIHRHDWPPWARSRIAIGQYGLAVGEFPTNSRSAPAGPFSRVDFACDQESDAYVCPAGKQLRKYRRPFVTPRIGAAPSSMKSTPAAYSVVMAADIDVEPMACTVRSFTGVLVPWIAMPDPRPRRHSTGHWMSIDMGYELHTRCIRPPVTPPSAGRA
jgi:hypothetical protein